ncbi:MAG: type I citrate synthase [Bacteroidetes bacterium GWA2_30_7]|nr:MAG: type I citrate synthase [Bacteroidetes bacterium GWA2_30_7]
MEKLKEKLARKIEEWRPRTTKLLKEHGNVVADHVTIEQIIGGARDIKCLVTDISYLDPFEGIRFRGFTIPEVMAKLPKHTSSEMPTVESFFYLLLTGDVPTAAEVEEVKEEFKKRKKVPQYVFDVINALPEDTHPMVALSAAIVSMQRESEFVKKYNAGMKKTEYWAPTYEDSLNLIAKLGEIGAYIYRKKYKGGQVIKSDSNLDFGGDFAHMMGIAKPYDDVARMYFILHSDHESGNVSAHTGHLISSALSDIYYSISGMTNGLAGPLHGLANQEVLAWLQGVMSKMEGRVPTKDEMAKFVRDTLDSGQVIPGFGHAVLRKTDPRYSTQREFCLKNLPDYPLFKYVDLLFQVVPDILLEKGKAKNPWPNVDAQSGVIQWYYGLTEYDFYTVLFAIGRALGVCSNIIWDRALGYALERPKSVTTAMLEEIAAKG